MIEAKISFAQVEAVAPTRVKRLPTAGVGHGRDHFGGAVGRLALTVSHIF